MKCNLPKQEKANGNLQMNLYDLNKQIINQLADASVEDLESAKQTIADYYNECRGIYYMMLCNELKYYTLFHVTPGLPNVFEDEVIECLVEFADSIKVIDKTEDQQAIEIWITKDEEAYVMYLFNYDRGVINCG